MTCPGCHELMYAVAQTRPDTPPWVCTACHRGFWNAELTPAARASYSPFWRAFIDPVQSIAGAVVGEIQQVGKQLGKVQQAGGRQ